MATGRKQFLSLRAKAREVEAGFSEESRLRGELEDVKRKQEIFEQAGYADVLQNFQKLSRQQRSVETWEESWADVAARLRQVADEMVPDPLEEKAFDRDLEADAELQTCAVTVCESLSELRKEIESLAVRADEILSGWKRKKDESYWKRGAAAAEQAYQNLKNDLAKEGKPTLRATVS